MRKLLIAAIFLTIIPLLHTEAKNLTFESWTRIASAATSSPVLGTKDDYHSQWAGPDGRIIKLIIQMPHPTVWAPTVVMGVVPEGEDARPYFEQAMQRALDQKAGHLIIQPGTYSFNSLDKLKRGHAIIDGLDDLEIEAQGARFVFTQNAIGVYITRCHRVRIKGLTIGYSLHSTSLARMTRKDGQNVLTVDSRFPISSTDGIGHIAEYDPTTSAYVLGGLRVYLPPGTPLVKQDGGRTYASPSFQSQALNGKAFMVFHHWYGGAAVNIQDVPGPQQSHDITLDGVTINSGPGMGIVAYGLARGLAVWNTRIIPADGSLASVEYDGIHILISGGDVSLRKNIIKGQGDDGINLNSPVIPIVEINAIKRELMMSTYSRFISPGDNLAFFTADNRLIGTALATSVSGSRGGPNNQYRLITLDSLPNGVEKGDFVRDVKIISSRVEISNNDIGDCQCHGILVQVPNVNLFQNFIHNTTENQIRLLTNLGTFKEGIGAINVNVSENTLINSGSDSGFGIPWASISVYGLSKSGLITRGGANRDIVINKNRIIHANQGCITVASSTSVKVIENQCIDTNLVQLGAPSLQILQSIDVTLSGNLRRGITTGSIVTQSSSTSEFKGQRDFDQ